MHACLDCHYKTPLLERLHHSALRPRALWEQQHRPDWFSLVRELIVYFGQKVNVHICIYVHIYTYIYIYKIYIYYVVSTHTHTQTHTHTHTHHRPGSFLEIVESFVKLCYGLPCPLASSAAYKYL